MAILITNDGDRIVQTIAERNTISKKFDGMSIRVNDATGDSALGGGAARYEWNAASSTWKLVWSDVRGHLELITEKLLIESGAVTASNIPNNEEVWSTRIVGALGNVITESVTPVIDGYNITVSPDNSLDGNYLEFSYAFGSISTQITSAIAALVDNAPLAGDTLAKLHGLITTLGNTLGNLETTTNFNFGTVNDTLANKVEQSDINAAKNSILGSVPVAGNTLAKLHSLIANLDTDVTDIQSLLTSDDLALDSLQEVVTFIKANRNDLNSITLDWSSIVGKPTTVAGYGITDTVTLDQDGLIPEALLPNTLDLGTL